MNDIKKYQVVVSTRAKDLLFEHAIFLSQVSIDAAYDLFTQFENRITTLENFPERCPHYENPYIPSGKYRKLSLGNYLLILFQVVGETVHIELVVDARAENKFL